MKALDDILFGFLIFFAIERLMRITSLMVIGPWIDSNVKNEKRAEGLKLFAEFALLIGAVCTVYAFRKPLSHLTN